MILGFTDAGEAFCISFSDVWLSLFCGLETASKSDRETCWSCPRDRHPTALSLAVRQGTSTVVGTSRCRRGTPHNTPMSEFQPCTPSSGLSSHLAMSSEQDTSVVSWFWDCVLMLFQKGLGRSQARVPSLVATTTLGTAVLWWHGQHGMPTEAERFGVFERHAQDMLEGRSKFRPGPTAARRRELVQKASGDVLEVAVGSGENFKHYSRQCL